MLNYKFNLKRSPQDHRDFMVESIFPDDVTLPEVYDLRSQMQPIRDQGQEGSCSAQTAAAMKEWQELVDVKFNEYMSPQFVYNLRPNQQEEGMTPRDTMDILLKIGIVPEKLYSYGTSAPISDELKKEAELYKIQGYAQVNTLDSLKKSIFANGPAYCAFPVYNSEKMEFWKQDYPNQAALGGHAVPCVGWLKDCFIIRNSWTAEWGDRGYCYFKFTDWGMQWETWSSIDATSNSETLKKKANDHMNSLEIKKGFFKKLFCK